MSSLGLSASQKLVAFSFLLFVSAPILSNLYKYYITQDYFFLVEANCNPENELCFVRDCTNSDECPPNGLSNYKEYYVKAFDFPKCSDNSCENECESGLIVCTRKICGSSAEDLCSSLPE